MPLFSKGEKFLPPNPLPFSPFEQGVFAKQTQKKKRENNKKYT